MDEEALLPLWNPEERRLRAGLRILTFLIVFIVVSEAVRSLAEALLFGSVVSQSSGATSTLSTTSESISVRLAAGVATLLSALVCVWAAGRFLDHRPFVDFGFALSGRWLGGWLFGFIAGALVISGVFLVALVLGWANVTEFLGGDRDSVLDIIGPPIFFALAAFAEDLIYWGYLLKNISEGLAMPGLGVRLPVLMALAAVAVFFAAIHALNPGADLLSTLNIGVGGIMLPLGYVLTGQLAIPIGLHLSWNLFQGYVFGSPVSGLEPAGATLLAIERDGPQLWTGGAFGIEASILGLAGMIVVCTVIILAVHLRGGASISQDISTFSPDKTGDRR